MRCKVCSRNTLITRRMQLDFVSFGSCRIRCHRLTSTEPSAIADDAGVLQMSNDANCIRDIRLIRGLYSLAYWCSDDSPYSKF